MAKQRRSNVAIKAGIFLTFCIGLFVAMLFVYGKFTRSWRGRQALHVVFTQVAHLHSDALVRYNGLEVGHVRKIRILSLNKAYLKRFHPFRASDIANLPLTEAEQAELRGHPQEELDALVRQRIAGRTMVELTLSVLAEGDVKRYREDDQVRVGSTLMGESSVEIISGSGRPLPPDPKRVLVGVSGDLYSNLSKSLGQVKNILHSIGRIVGGGAPDLPLGRKLANFDRFTARMDRLAGSLEKNLPGVWDALDGHLDEGRDKVDEVKKAIANIGPELGKGLSSAEKSLEEMRGTIRKTSGAGREKIKKWRQKSLDVLQTLRELAQTNKERVPILVRDAREWSERFDGKVGQVETWMAHFDVSLRQGIESTRQTLQGMRSAADGIEEKLWYLAHYPGTLISKPRGMPGLAMDAKWRRQLMARHYAELRGELGRARRALRVTDPSDRARLQRIDQILKNLDGFLLAPPGLKAEKRRRR